MPPAGPVALLYLLFAGPFLFSVLFESRGGSGWRHHDSADLSATLKERQPAGTP
jgi:hypothetical protein